MKQILEFIRETESAVLIARCKAVMAGIEVQAVGRSRVVRYGYGYNPGEGWIADIPAWATPLLTGVPGFAWNSLTINEYQPGAGIAMHVDSYDFADPIVILSLGSGVTLDLSGPEEERHVWMAPRSLLLLTGESRTWRHGIAPRDSDWDDRGKLQRRALRYSLVFRDKVKNL